VIVKLFIGVLGPESNEKVAKCKANKVLDVIPPKVPKLMKLTYSIKDKFSQVPLKLSEVTRIFDLPLVPRYEESILIYEDLDNTVNAEKVFQVFLENTVASFVFRLIPVSFNVQDKNIFHLDLMFSFLSKAQ